MVYPDRLYRCNIVGTTPGEQIVNTLWVQVDSGFLGTTSAQEIADKVKNAWTTAVTVGFGTGKPPLAPQFHTGTVWNKVSCYKVDGNGRATEQAESLFAGTVKGSAVSAMPPQIAITVTLLTKVPGRRGRGRIYLGGLNRSLALDSGRINPAEVTSMVATMGAFYADVRDLPNQEDAFRPVVVSPTSGQANKITRVQIGDVFDTMRSRRGKLVEARQSAVVDAT